MIKSTLPFIALFLLFQSSYSQIPEWGHILGENNSNSAEVNIEAVTADGFGNTYFGGSFIANTSISTTFDFDPGLGTAQVTGVFNDGYDGFLLKLDSFGNFVNLITLEGDDDNKIFHLGADAAGNIVSCGTFRDTVDFDPGPGFFNMVAVPTAPPLSNWEDVFVQKTDPDGNLIWAKRFGNDWREWIRDMHVDGYGNVYLIGEFRGLVDFDPGVGVVNKYSNDLDIFILKLDNNGDYAWAATTENGSCVGPGSLGLSVTADQWGNVYSTGSFDGGEDFDPGPGVFSLANAVGRNYIRKLDIHGEFLWAKPFGGTGYIEDHQINIDSAGNIYLNGIYGGQNTDFDPDTSTYYLNNTTQFGYTFFCKLDSSGRLLWVNEMQGTGLQEVAEVQIDHEENIYVTGNFTNMIDLDPDPNTTDSRISNLYNTTYIQKLGPNGDLIYAHSFGEQDIATSSSIWIDRHGDIHFAGSFSSVLTGGIDFHPGTPVLDLSTSSGRPFMLKYTQDTCASLDASLADYHDVTCNTVAWLVLEPTGGAPPYTYQWSHSAAITDSIISPIQPGIYTTTITDAIGCTLEKSYLVEASVPGFDLLADQFNTGFQPGQNTTVWLNASNLGCYTIGAPLHLIFEGPISFVSSTTGGFTQSGDTLTWQVPVLAFDNVEWATELVFHTDSNATGFDDICLEIRFDTMPGDANPINNYKDYCFKISSSSAPNEKTVYPQGECTAQYVENGEEPLTYTIRFQNDGAATVTDVHILDTLSPDLDFSTLRIIDHSHPMYTEILPNQELKFAFDGINLPSSQVNEPASHGFVTFEIWPDSTLFPGTIIMNSAGVYLDQSTSDQTNIVFNTMVDSVPPCFPVAVEDEAEAIRFYPNPNQGSFVIDGLDAGTSTTVEVYSIDGKLVFRKEVRQVSRVPVALDQRSGLYMVRVTNGQGQVWIRKVLVRDQVGL